MSSSSSSLTVDSSSPPLVGSLAALPRLPFLQSCLTTRESSVFTSPPSLRFHQLPAHPLQNLSTTPLTRRRTPLRSLRSSGRGGSDTAAAARSIAFARSATILSGLENSREEKRMESTSGDSCDRSEVGRGEDWEAKTSSCMRASGVAERIWSGKKGLAQE
jgi:hypothetical protein